MKFLLFLFFIHSQIFSASFTFENPCPHEDDFIVQNIRSNNLSIGEMTHQILEKTKYSYIGSQLGLNSLWHSPMGMEALDIVSKVEMYSYGWCYSVNGVVPEKLPHQVILKDSDQVIWWFGYAHYLRGEWLSQCEHSDSRPITSFCHD